VIPPLRRPKSLKKKEKTVCLLAEWLLKAEAMGEYDWQQQSQDKAHPSKLT